jgi:hypothetical protein
VNTNVLTLFEKLNLGYHPPRTAKTFISEFYLGQETIERHLGTSMHVFLLNLPGLEFAALIPKGDYVTLCMLGQKIDDALVQTFLSSAEVKRCMPPAWQVPKNFCHCSPKICIQGAKHPFGDRIVFIGDSGVTRLYKDGIGAAYRTAKAAAVTAVFEGVSEAGFRRKYWPVCRTILWDNLLGNLIFYVTRLIQKQRLDREGLLRMVTKEQASNGAARRMSLVLWDVFTGSAPYREVLLRTMHPAFLAHLLWQILSSLADDIRVAWLRRAEVKP